MHTDERRRVTADGDARSYRKIAAVVARTRTLESFFGLLNHGLIGMHRHVSAAHLQRRYTEFGFRFRHRKVSNEERATVALKGIKGKRLTPRHT